VKRLVLAGGGHAHVEVLRRLAQRRPRHAEIVLITPEPALAYSGMLPGHVAGYYARGEMFIDLARLAAACRARMVAARVAGIDADARELMLEDGTRLGYDLASLDTGAQPTTGAATGVREHALTAKPIAAFLDRWNAFAERAVRGGVRRVAVVGGGAGGVEMVLAMRRALEAAVGAGAVQWHLFTDAAELLPGHAPAARRMVESVLRDCGVVIHRATRIAAVEPDAIRAEACTRFQVDATVWVTGASAPAWLGRTTLARDDAGFVSIDATLRSTSHPSVFAAGDVASMAGFPRPKSGVYAVRQGPPLARNLAAALDDAPLARFVPQRHALALLATADGSAIATRGALAVRGPCVWWWKNWIDRRFVARYR
jgi:selenide,water dikinase